MSWPQMLTDDLVAIRRWSQGLSPIDLAELDTINFIVGDGSATLTTGIKGAIHVDFNAIITGSYVHEFDGVTGSVSVGIDKAAYVVGSAPSFSSIVASAPPMIASARYGENETLTGWTVRINRKDVLRFSLNSVSSFTRLLIALRIRRLEP